MSSERVFETMSREDAINALWIWLDKGHGVIEAFRVLRDDEGGLYVGIVDYVNEDDVRIPEHLNRPHASYRGVFGAFGSLVDAMGLDEEEGSLCR